jgi:hypothetical protein
MGIFLPLHHLPLLLLLPLALIFLLVATADSDSVTLNITNQCSYTVWPAALPMGGGMRLDPGKTWTLNIPTDPFRGHVWARTGCSFDHQGNGSCKTGDCRGLLNCTSDGTPPFTAADFSLNQYDNNSFFDISLYQGFNVPMEFLPIQVKGGPFSIRGKIPSLCINRCMRPFINLINLFNESEIQTYYKSWIAKSLNMNQPSEKRKKNKPPQDLHVSRLSIRQPHRL